MKKLYSLLLLLFLVSCGADSDSVSLGPGNGVTSIAGSTSGFTIINDHLYVLSTNSLKVLDISDAQLAPVLVNQMEVPANLETIFRKGQNLFLGADNGVYIYDVSLPEKPAYISRYQHQTGCDPVVANDKFAYVTIRDGNACGRNSINQLITLDISDVTNPVNKSVINMIRPRGLGFFQGDLYVGEGIYGLKKFDLSEGFDPKLDTFYTAIPANDLIGLTNSLLITSNSGITQYTKDGEALQLISRFR
ncbi:MAG: hypothetical protein RIA69_02315 [Cyclobacteriaceae bacterium]